MNYFLVDYENIGFSWMKNDVGIREGDILIVFYSEQRKGLNLDEMDNLLKLNVDIQLLKVGVGSKNALDFQAYNTFGLSYRNAFKIIQFSYYFERQRF